MIKNTPKLTLTIISATIIIALAILYNTKSTTQGINKNNSQNKKSNKNNNNKMCHKHNNQNDALYAQQNK